MFAALLAPAALAVCTGSAEAQSVRLIARDGARVQAAVPSTLQGQALRLTVDGHRKRIVDRPATFSIHGLTGSGTRWHELRLHGRRSTATARFLVGRRHGAHAPTLVLTGAPDPTTTDLTATFRYTASGGRVRCTVDGKATPCSGGHAKVTAAPGVHRLAVLARSGRSTATLSWTWTVRGSTAAPVSSAPSTNPSPTGPADPTSSAAPPAGAGDGSDAAAGWRLILSDSFDGSSLDTSKWQAYGPNWPGNGGNGLRDGSAVSVGGGVLTITAQMVGRTLVSGAVASRVSMTYGRVEFRARTDADPSDATSGVVLLWPNSDRWPIDGETDIYETGTDGDRDWFSSFVHYGASNQQLWFGHDADATQWHAMAVEWTPSAIRFYRDGILEGTVTDPAAISRAAQHLCVQLDAFSPSMTGVVHMQVDDVRIYALGG